MACFRPPAPAAVPRQLFDDSPSAAELVLPLKGRRVGVYWRLFKDAAPEVVAACRAAVSLLEEHGCEVTVLLSGACTALSCQRITVSRKMQHAERASWASKIRGC